MQKIKHFKSLVWKLLASLCLLGALGFFVGKSFFPHTYHFAFPVQFSQSNKPYLPIKIEDRSYLIGIDLGSKFQIMLNEKTLDQLTKTPHGTGSWINVKGKQFTTPCYKIPQIDMGGLSFKNILAVQSDPKENPSISQNSESDAPYIPCDVRANIVGNLGKRLLEKVNILFDINRSLILASNDLKKLKQAGYDLKTFIKVPLNITRKSVIVNAKTDLGLLRFGLDTGATYTALRTSCLKGKACSKTILDFPAFSSNIFEIDGYNFGPQDMICFDIADAIYPIDGILGIDFFQAHVIYIDFKHQVGYIKPLK